MFVLFFFFSVLVYFLLLFFLVVFFLFCFCSHQIATVQNITSSTPHVQNSLEVYGIHQPRGVHYTPI